MPDIVRDPYGNPLKRDATIDALRAEVERLRVKSIQMQAALGYGILAEDERHIIPSNPFKCGICDANKHLRAENERLRAAGNAIIDFYNGPLEAKRPDIFHRLMVRLNAALEEKS